MDSTPQNIEDQLLTSSLDSILPIASLNKPAPKIHKPNQKTNKTSPKAKEFCENADFKIGTDENQHTWFDGMFNEFVHINNPKTNKKQKEPKEKEYTFSYHAIQKLNERSIATQEEIIHLINNNKYWPLFKESSSDRQHLLMYFPPSDSFIIGIVDMKCKLFVSIWYPDYGQYREKPLDLNILNSLKALVNSNTPVSSYSPNYKRSYTNCVVGIAYKNKDETLKYQVLKKITIPEFCHPLQTMESEPFLQNVISFIISSNTIKFVNKVYEQKIGGVYIEERDEQNQPLERFYAPNDLISTIYAKVNSPKILVWPPKILITQSEPTNRKSTYIIHCLTNKDNKQSIEKFKIHAPDKPIANVLSDYQFARDLFDVISDIYEDVESFYIVRRNNEKDIEELTISPTELNEITKNIGK